MNGKYEDEHSNDRALLDRVVSAFAIFKSHGFVIKYVSANEESLGNVSVWITERLDGRVLDALGSGLSYLSFRQEELSLSMWNPFIWLQQSVQLILPGTNHQTICVVREEADYRNQGVREGRFFSRFSKFATYIGCASGVVEIANGSDKFYMSVAKIITQFGKEIFEVFTLG